MVDMSKPLQILRNNLNFSEVLKDKSLLMCDIGEQTLSETTKKMKDAVVNSCLHNFYGIENHCGSLSK